MPSVPILHVQPSADLPSLDPACLAAYLYLQTRIPGRFSVSPCTNIDLSPSGSLPFLTHNSTSVASLPAIINYLEQIYGAGSVSADAGLTAIEEAQKTAWSAHIEAKLGTLVAFTHYTLEQNWHGFVGLAMIKSLPVPARYYVPRRRRNAFKARLQAAGLYPSNEEEAFSALHSEKEKLRAKVVLSGPERLENEVRIRELDNQIAEERQRLATSAIPVSEVFRRDRAKQYAQDVLERYARLLGSQQFFFRDHPTSLDFLVAAHILLLVRLPLTDNLISEVVHSFPSLVEHADRVMDLSSSHPPPVVENAANHSWRSFLPLIPQRPSKEEIATIFDPLALGWIVLSEFETGLQVLIDARTHLGSVSYRRMSTLAARLRQLHSVPVSRRPYSSFFSKAGGGGRYFNAHGKPTKQPVVAAGAKDTPSAAQQPTDADKPDLLAAEDTPTIAAPNATHVASSPAAPSPPPRFSTTTVPLTHPMVDLKDFHLNQFFSLHRPLLLLHDPAAILRTPHPAEPLFPEKKQPQQAEAQEGGSPLLDPTLRSPNPNPDQDAEVARQLARALTMNRAGAVASWESTLERLGLDVGAETQIVQAAEWNDGWEDIESGEIHADSTKRKRRRKMKKHKLRKRRKLTRSERLKLK
ncbi:Tom37 domain-containing protein [Mycena kentingensis (nom. inval.)]|nr:Tom37 domain-containing protein [Mycena kentingensis (nom. inval.)]